MSSLLEVKDLEVKFGLRGGDLTAINGISFSLDKGQLTIKHGNHSLEVSCEFMGYDGEMLVEMRLPGKKYLINEAEAKL